MTTSEKSFKDFKPMFNPWISFQEAVALIHLSLHYSFEFDDGFIINADDDMKMLGRSEAALIASVFCQKPNKDWKWWKAEFDSADLQGKDYEAVFDRVLLRFFKSRRIRAVRKW